MHKRRIGNAMVSAIGLGGMPLSIEGRPDEERAVATIHAALDAGISFIDTAMSYCLNASETGHNESLIARALAAYGGDTSAVLVGTKGGAAREADGAWSFKGDPATLREACEGSLRRLGVDAIGLYQLHVPDPNVPYADSVGALRDLYDAGKIRAVGISNVNSDQLREAHGILGERLVSVQNNFSCGHPRQRAAAAAVRRAGDRLPAVQPTGRHLPGGRPGFIARCVCPDCRGTRRESAASLSGLGVGQVPRRHPDPGIDPADHRSRLGGSGRPEAHRSGVRRTRRGLANAGWRSRRSSTPRVIGE